MDIPASKTWSNVRISKRASWRLLANCEACKKSREVSGDAPWNKIYHWQTGGQPDAKNDVPPLSPEAMAIANVTVALCVHVLQIRQRITRPARIR